jgi:hypothetical protein
MSGLQILVHRLRRCTFRGLRGLSVGTRVHGRPTGRLTVRRPRIGLWLLIQKSIKKILVQARRIEGITAASMRQREPGRGTNIGLGDLAAPLPGRMGSRRSCGNDVGSHAVDLKGPADPRDSRELPIIEAYRWQQRSGSDDLGPEFISLAA